MRCVLGSAEAVATKASERANARKKLRSIRGVLDYLVPSIISLRHSEAMRSIELWCAIAHLRISRFRARLREPPRNDSREALRRRAKYTLFSCRNHATAQRILAKRRVRFALQHPDCRR